MPPALLRKISFAIPPRLPNTGLQLPRSPAQCKEGPVVLLLLVAVLLSATPVIVTILFLWIGLTTQADLLLARLDSAVRSCESLAHTRPYLLSHIWEDFNYVKWYASPTKIHQLMGSPAEKPSGSIMVKAMAFYEERLEGTWTTLRVIFRNAAKYVLPSLILTCIYLAGAALIALLACLTAAPDAGWLVSVIQGFAHQYIGSLACCGNPNYDYLGYTFIGAFLFNTGIMVRRTCAWDITGQMFWWAVYRVLLSLALAEVIHFSTDKLASAWYLLVATISVSVLDSLIRNLRSKLFQSESAPKQNELSLQLIQGVDYWKEQRLAEEGIESIEHLATSDFVLLALRIRTNLYTVADWVDQAIAIQRFPGRTDKLRDAGLPISAVELTWSYEQLAPNQRDIYIQQVAKVLAIEPMVLFQTFAIWLNDTQVQLLTLFWRADLGAGTSPESTTEMR
jgi:hypothetical protein